MGFCGKNIVFLSGGKHKATAQRCVDFAFFVLSLYPVRSFFASKVQKRGCMNQITELDKRIIELSDRFEQEVLNLRRAIHENPELSFHEVQTAGLVQRALEGIGLAVKCGIAGTGLIADIHGFKPGRTLLLRADMDALPIQEQNDLPFRSKNDSVMHACGHDVHTANLVGVAKILYELRDSWSGTIRLVFQPAEENGGGGREMIRAGIFG